MPLKSSGGCFEEACWTCRTLEPSSPAGLMRAASSMRGETRRTVLAAADAGAGASAGAGVGVGVGVWWWLCVACAAKRGPDGLLLLASLLVLLTLVVL